MEFTKALQSPGTQPAASSQELLQAQPTSLEQLRRFAEAGFLYAVLDSTDQPKVPEKCRELGEERSVSLFRGSAEEEYWAVAPYLVRLDSALLDWIIEHLWKEPWGVFVMSKADMELLRNHLRRFLMVQLPDGERWFFRFYDPRILKLYLPSCSSWELERFYGPVRAFALLDPENTKLWIVQRSETAKPPDPNAVDTDPTATLLWTIRTEQFSLFEQSAQKNFEDRVLAHVSEYFPVQCKQAGEPAVREAIQYGVQKARSYGITSERDVCKYVDLMFGFGRDFDQDPNLPWAAPVLKDASLPPGDKIARLFEIVHKLAERGAASAG